MQLVTNASFIFITLNIEHTPIMRKIMQWNAAITHLYTIVQVNYISRRRAFVKTQGTRDKAVTLLPL